MLWTELQTRVTYPFSGAYSSEALTFLTDAQSDMSVFARCYERDFTTMCDYRVKKRIELPSDFVSMVEDPIYGGTRLSLYQPAIYQSDRYTSSHALATGTPEHYRIEGNSLVLFPWNSGAKILTMRYFAKADRLDSAETHYKLNYDGLNSKAFLKNDLIKGETTGTTAYVDRDISNNDGSGTLIIRDMVTTTGYANGFNNNENVNVIDSENNAYEGVLATTQTFSDLLQHWDDLGLGGQAVVKGRQYTENSTDESGTIPVIPGAYHHILIEYAQSKIYDMLGEKEDSARMMNTYLMNRTAVSESYHGRTYAGPMQVADVL